MAAVVGMPDAIKGQGIAAFVTLNAAHARNSKTSPADLIVELRQHVTKEIGALARPDLIRFTEMLPKTRSGKIMRRLLKDIAAGRDITSDITTLEDPKVIESLRQLQR
jgi:acetyl-CoA synthetase